MSSSKTKITRYKVELNNYGEVLTYWTEATSPNRALRNAVFKLAQATGRDYTFVLQQFMGDKDNFVIKKRPRED